jgi:sigma-E factor negative regulatory protein RseA
MTNSTSLKTTSTDMPAPLNTFATGQSPDETTALAISAWMDGDEQVDLPQHVFKQEGQQTWALYHLIGDALRTPELVAPVGQDFQAKLFKALEQEPALLAPAAMPTPVKAGLWRQYAIPSFAMAAAVAAVVWVARPFLIPESSTARVDQIASVSTPALANPVVVRDYVAAHRQLAGPAAVRQVSFGGTQ